MLEWLEGAGPVVVVVLRQGVQIFSFFRIPLGIDRPTFAAHRRWMRRRDGKVSDWSVRPTLMGPCPTANL